MASAAISADKKKKLAHHVDRSSREGGSGMSSATKRHFDHVKRKMFAFVDRQQRMEMDAFELSPPLAFHRHVHPHSDQQKASKHQLHHRTPVPSHKQLVHLHVPVPPHKQLPHLALATPQVVRRGGKSRSNMDGRLSPNVVFF